MRIGQVTDRSLARTRILRESTLATRILHYACGGGLGHMTRSVALLRKLASLADVDVLLLANSEFADCVRPELDRLPSVTVMRPVPGYSVDATLFYADLFDTFTPDLLIVDTFPRGLIGELAIPEVRNFVGTIPSVLISRTLPPEYVDGYDVRAFAAEQYQLIIVPGESSPFEDFDCAIRTAPFLIRSHDEIEVDQTESDVVLFIGTGTHGESQQLRDLAEAAAGHDRPCPVRFVGPDQQEFPLIYKIAAARGVVGAAGYNLAHEVKALGVPSMLFARPRKYDNQRMRANCPYPTVEEVVRFMRRLPPGKRKAVPEFENGAEAAANAVSELLRSLRDSPE